MNKNLLFSQRTQAIRRLRFLSNYYLKLKQVKATRARLDIVQGHIKAHLLYLKGKATTAMIKHSMGAAFAFASLFVSTTASAQNFLPADSLTQVTTQGPIIPDLVDFDNDGDVDVIGISYDNSGYELSGFFIENTGTAEEFVIENVQLENPDIALELGTNSIFLEAADMDNDGDLDLVLLENDYYTVETFVLYYENDGEGTYRQPPERILVGSELDIYGSIDPNLVDFDDDGDLDLLTVGYDIAHYQSTGEPTLNVFFSENIGTADSLSFANVVPLDGFKRIPITDADAVFLTNLEIADFDNDGDLDMVLLEPMGYYDFVPFYYENEGGGFLSQGMMSQFTTPPGIILLTSGDIDNDGDIDLLYEYYGDTASDFESDLFLIINDNISSVDETLEGEISIVENPIADVLFVNVSDIEAGNYDISVLSSIGQIILNQKANLSSTDNIRLSLAHLNSGQYFFKISSAKGIKTLPFIKQ